MKLSVIEGNTQRLDGGAMFGNAPREMWKWWAQVDHQNRITLATRCLLWELDDGRRVLFEAGIGTFFEPKYRERYGIMQDEHQLLKNLEAQGLTDADIDCVILSHMHFDHAGGLFATWDGSPP
ncbi:MAG: MBL fold metallo-hydrolase, partial [Chlamydiia bacterium]|nr:MBL fold metallo-hydrolase [Chlamydiia bacterium]